MLIGIINQKTKEKMIGTCSIEEVKIGGNKTITVICNDYIARALDKIMFQCDECGKEDNVIKRMFFRGNKDINQLCKKCITKKTSIDRYGVESPNQSAKIKQKQHSCHSDRINFIDGNENRPSKTSSPKELAKLRSDNAKQHWANGVYSEMNELWSQKAKERFADDDWKESWLAGINTDSAKRKKSNATKRRWENKEYREKMSKIGTRISKFQKRVFETMSYGWVMELPIDDTTFTVDMCNPETMEVVECYGDYWHCNPEKYDKDYYHQRVKKTAQEIWSHDEERIKLLEDMGYSVKIIWEGVWNNK